MQDYKYDILKHPNAALTTDGKAKPYKHGEDTRSFASILFDPALLDKAVEFEITKADFELLSKEELEEYFNK